MGFLTAGGMNRRGAVVDSGFADEEILDLCGMEDALGVVDGKAARAWEFRFGIIVRAVGMLAALVLGFLVTATWSF